MNPRSSGDRRPATRPAGGTGLPDPRMWGAGLRSALHALTALIAVGATVALLSAAAATAQVEDTAASAPTVTTPSAEPESAAEPDGAAEPEPPPAPANPPASPAPANPPAVQTETPPPTESQGPQQWDGSADYEAPSPPADPRPDESQPPAGEAPGEPAPDEGSQDPPQAPGGAGAHNQSTVLQAIVQVQRGCRTHCRGTSQTQSGTQWADTTQSATAITPDGDASGAAALNQSSIMQFVWQMQLGCVAFCWDTEMSQSATQEAQTTQTATAESDGTALAANIGQTIQRVWQLQDGCRIECYGVSESQSLFQRQTTSQSATATGPEHPTPADWPGEGPGGLPSWLTAFAESIGVTIQTIFQYQEASCLEHCGEEELVQAAAQRAATDQTTTAGDVPDPVSEPPATTEPPPAAETPSAPGTPAAPERLPGSGEDPAAATAAVAPGGPTAALRQPGRKVTRQGDGRLSGHGAPHRRSRRSTVALSAVLGAQDGQAPSSGADGRRSGHTRSTPAARAIEGAPTPKGAASQPHVALETSAATGSGGGPGIPWLAVGFLLIAAFASILGLRPRPRLGA